MKDEESGFVCLKCRSTFRSPKRYMAGSFVIELFLWLLLILPGVIYSVWRLTTKAAVCPVCSSREIIPRDSPEGRRLAVLGEAA